MKKAKVGMQRCKQSKYLCYHTVKCAYVELDAGFARLLQLVECLAQFREHNCSIESNRSFRRCKLGNTDSGDHTLNLALLCLKYLFVCVCVYMCV